VTDIRDERYHFFAYPPMTKQHILDEIRRTARNGVALGVDRFFKETGIRESDWRGRFWVRWSDAIAEAGLQPNQWQGAIEEKMLFEKLIGFVRELGHFPVMVELRMRATNDPDFPNPKTFNSRFGSKPEMIAKVRAYCEERTEYSDVLALCPLPVKDGSTEDPSKREGEGEFGFVYLLKSGRYYKIGYSNAVGRRERELAIQLPNRCSVIHSIKTDDPAGIEAYWHRRFDAKHKNGEWFELDPSDVKAFKRRTFM
jgi:hypothetical protein